MGVVFFLLKNQHYKLPAALNKAKIKVQFTLEQSTKTQKGSRGIALLFL
jgi:hypothetical protein